MAASLPVKASSAAMSAEDPRQEDGLIVARWFSGLIEERERLFWTLQAGGWTFYALIRFLNGLAFGFTPDYILQCLWATAIAFLLTLAMRYALKAVWAQGPTAVFTTALVLTPAASAIFSVVELWGLAEFYEPDWNPKGWQLLGNSFYDAAIILAWVGLYIGIKYFRQYREQAERMLKVTAMAHQAQLKMLRYQLNPHFLFNTLNAISTLLLDRNAPLANRMLTKLSAFLRYTLINQPTQRVSLEQELQALSLYLDIERVRFEDRLHIDMRVSDEAKTALLPSLLLQPLIENAIKYAIAPSEEGGAITLSAQVKAGRLDLVLADTGPGLADPAAIRPSTSSGVGIANTRERLAQIYNGDFSFEMRNRVPKGLEIHISLPFETRAGGPTRADECHPFATSGPGARKKR
ncbi:MAG: sensor histidine kinase [Pseudomonadota bacterium]